MNENWKDLGGRRDSKLNYILNNLH
jgi:hypothetical protein